MNPVRMVLSLVVVLALSGPFAQAASAAGGGGGGGLGGAQGSGRDLNKVFQEAVQLLADGDCKKAARNFKKVLKAASRNPEANYLRGVALQCLNKHKAAVRYYKKAVKYDDEFYVAYERLGTAYLAIGKSEDAVAQLRELETFRETCGQDCPAKLHQAHASLESAIAAPSDEEPKGGDQKDAQSLLFDPVTEPHVAYLEAVQLINSARFQEAIEMLRELSAAIGPHPDVLNYLGYANRRLRNFDRAKAYYDQALSLEPLHRGANEYLGEMWVELGRLEDAQRRLAALDAACPFGCAEYDDLERLIGQRIVATH